MAPWTASEMQAKGAKRPEAAARRANAILASCQARATTSKQRAKCEGLAIATALAMTNRPAKGK